jgi:stage II sporulation protein R
MSKVLLMIKELGNNQRNYAIAKIGTVIFITAVVVMSLFFMSYSNDVNKGLADNLIRLHVLANSDSREDQQLKYEIRDMVLELMRNELKESRDPEQTKYIINSNLNRVEEIAASVIRSRGKAYDVKATLGSYPFPTKTYGDVTLPAGNYQALRVVIGKGEGTNWWCVLFPPLCFVDATHGTIPDHVREKLKDSLTNEEYSIITSASDESDIPIRIRFKVVEFFQDSKIRFTGLISKIFSTGE